jgi:hypothetical protein
MPKEPILLILLFLRLLKSSRDLLRVLKSFGDHRATMRMTEEERDGVSLTGSIVAVLAPFSFTSLSWLVSIVINHFNIAVFVIISGCHWFDNELWRWGRGYKGRKSVCNVLIYFFYTHFKKRRASLKKVVPDVTSSLVEILINDCIGFFM